MTRSILCILFLAAVGVESAVFQARQLKTPKKGEPMCLGPGGKVADPDGALPKKIKMAAPMGIEGRQRVKMRYGPWKVPNMTVKSIAGEGGSLWNCADYIEKPCEECTVIRIVPGLEYANGSTANVDTGMWLHHVLVYTLGPTRWDPTCVGRDSAPHVAIGSDANHSERWTAAGNERTPTDFSLMRLNGKKTGYHVRKDDQFRILVDLMNMNMDDRVVYFTVEYDFVDGPIDKSEWMDLKPVWLDIDLCGLSEVKPPQQKGNFDIAGPAWVPNFEGDVIGVAGHLHDGGAHLEIMSSPSTLACNSTAKYGETSEFLFRQEMKMPDAPIIAEKHISSMSFCFNQMMPVRKLERSQQWILNGHYDYDRFPGNTEHDGKQQDIMGLALMYVAVPPGGVPSP